MKILLGVSGSIAAYKSLDICRQLVNLGHEVKVVLTQGAQQFVKEEVFHYLGAKGVYSSDEDFRPQYHPESKGPVLHITLSRWCDRFVICPLSANTLSKLCRGEASDLLTSIALSLGNKPLILYPAMNTSMLEHPITQENFQRMARLPNVFTYPADAGPMVCGERGEGKLPPVEGIVETIPILCHHLPDKKSILLTAGATVAPIDPIRYLTNPSSGKTAHLLAKRFLQEGHRVTVIAGQQSAHLFNFLLPLPQFTLRTVLTTQEMEREVLANFPQCDVYISAAAICDIEFIPSQEKIKKETFETHLPFKKTTDILEKVLSLRSPQQTIVGFAAETDPSPEVLLKKWQRKPVDFLVGNQVHNGMIPGLNPIQGFGTDEGLYYFVKDGKIIQNEKLSKTELAEEIYQWTMNQKNRPKTQGKRSS